jgi:hypothetical protein
VANPIEGELNIDTPPIRNEMETVPSTPTDFSQPGTHTAPSGMNHPSEDSLQFPEPIPLTSLEKTPTHLSANPPSEDTIPAPATRPEEQNVRRSRRLQGHKALYTHKRRPMVARMNQVTTQMRSHHLTRTFGKQPS